MTSTQQPTLGETLPVLDTLQRALLLADCPDCITVDDPADCPTCGGERVIITGSRLVIR